MSCFPCALLLRLFSIVQFREVLLVAGLCELSCSVAYGRVRFCSAKILLLNFSSPHFLVQCFISDISLKSQGLSLKRIAPDHDRDKSLESLFHQNTASWICGHFRFAVFCRHLHLECMKFIRGVVLAANNWKLVKFQKKSFRSEGEIKADYLETLLDAKNYDNFVWVDVLSFPWLSSFRSQSVSLWDE